MLTEKKCSKSLQKYVYLINFSFFFSSAGSLNTKRLENKHATDKMYGVARVTA